jgi:hypothetical protein
LVSTLGTIIIPSVISGNTIGTGTPFLTFNAGGITQFSGTYTWDVSKFGSGPTVQSWGSTNVPSSGSPVIIGSDSTGKIVLGCYASGVYLTSSFTQTNNSQTPPTPWTTLRRLSFIVAPSLLLE